MPFKSHGHGAGRLDDAGTEEWINICFGRGLSVLSDTSLCAANSLSSSHSVRRSQVVTAQALHNSQKESIGKALSCVNARTSVVVYKHLWDETGIRVQMPFSDLQSLVGEDMAEQVGQVRARGRAGRGSVYPGFVVQSMQGAAFLRFGRGDNEAFEIIVPPKIVSSTDADAIWAGVFAQLGCLGVEHLRAVSLKTRVLVAHMFPDGHPSNIVVMQQIIRELPFCCFMMGHCMAHNLQLVWDTGARKNLANPLYQLVQLLNNSATNAKVLASFDALAVDTDVQVGVELADASYRECVLHFTVRRPLIVQSFFVDPGAERHDAQVWSELRANIDQSCSELRAGLSGTWLEPVCTHKCFGVLPGRRCCPTVAAAKQQTGSSLKKLREHTLGSMAKVAVNKWRSISAAVTKVSIGLLANGCLKAAFERSLSTPAERRRLKAVIQVHHDLLAAAGVDGGGVSDPNAFRVLRGKRILGVHDWLNHPESRLTLISFLVGSAPIDKLFATIFECEAFAKSRGGRAGAGGAFDQRVVRGRVGLLQSLSSRTGILHKVHVMLCASLCNPAGVGNEALKVLMGAFGSNRAARIARQMQLRLSAAFRFRFLETWWNEEHSLLQMLDESPEERPLRIQRLMAPNPRCIKCLGLFVLRLRERLAAPPPLSPEEMLAVVMEVLESIAEDPYLISMHFVEDLHAAGKQVGARSMDRRKRLPVHLFSCQTLQRWVVLHKSHLGVRYCAPLSVRKAILKPKAQPAQARQVSGHNLFTKEALEARRATTKRGRVDYNTFLSKQNAVWRSMSDAEKEPYEQQAQNAPVKVRFPTRACDGASLSPWGIGSSTYPLSGEELRKTVDSLLPSGRQWLRSAFDKCMTSSDPDSIAKCIVPTKSSKLDLRSLRAQRKKNQTCFEAHPGLCCKDPHFSSILGFHAGLRRAIKSFSISPEDSDGQSLFVFAGYKQKRPADQMQARFHRERGIDAITADEFDCAFLSDQPDIRRGLMTWALCTPIIRERTFNMGTWARLNHTGAGTFEESISFEFAKRLRDRCKYWLVFSMAYKDDEDSAMAVQALSVQ